MYIVKKQLKDFSYAHRLTKGYKGKCCHTHGHEGKILVTIGSEELNEFDMVIDFTKLKMLDDWVQSHMDHAQLFCKQDFPVGYKDKAYKMSYRRMPTAESIACELYCVFRELLLEEDDRLQLLSVEVWETAGASAVYNKEQYEHEFEDSDEK